jgi:radical SAM protein with 4Fe4S-binding SPASM domain
MNGKIIFDKSNCHKVREILESAKADRKRGFDFEFCPDKEILNSKKVQEIINFLFFFEKFFQIRIKDVPYCLISDSEDRIILNEPSKKKVHLGACRSCRYEKRCGGILKDQVGVYKDYIKAVKDLPREIIIEIEAKCNYNCLFCFNKNSFAKNGRKEIKILNTAYVKKIIRTTAKSGVKIIRFTGGEPMLRKDIWQLMDYAKNKGLKIRLNTNGSLIDTSQIVKKLNKYISSILLPIESYNNKEESFLTGRKDSLKEKIKAIKLLKKYGKMVIRAGTIATKNNIKNLEKIFSLVIKDLDLDDWELYRPIPLLENKLPIDRKDLKILIDKLLKFQKLTSRRFSIVNAVPFCAYNPLKVDQVSNGGLSVDGHIRYVIDPRGFAKPDYYINKNIGSPLDVLGCWNHSFMKKMRNLKFLPKECRNCQYLVKCRGGSRFSAYFCFGKWEAKDPLMP